MERREFIEGAAILAAGLAATAATAASGTEKIAAPAASALILNSPDAVKALPKFAEAAAACAMSGDVCAEHCQEELATGATEFSNCSIATVQMALICGTVAKLATMKSVRLSETLEACTAACKACKEACEEHKAHWKKGMHLECKACAEHCEKLIAAITKLKAVLGKS